jgi:hypothetical protein
MGAAQVTKERPILCAIADQIEAGESRDIAAAVDHREGRAKSGM